MQGYDYSPLVENIDGKRPYTLYGLQGSFLPNIGRRCRVPLTILSAHPVLRNYRAEMLAPLCSPKRS